MKDQEEQYRGLTFIYQYITKQNSVQWTGLTVDIKIKEVVEECLTQLFRDMGTDLCTSSAQTNPDAADCGTEAASTITEDGAKEDALCVKINNLVEDKDIVTCIQEEEDNPCEEYCTKKAEAALWQQLANVRVPVRTRGESCKYSGMSHCLYCSKFYKSQIARHYLRIHRKETAVKEILKVRSARKKNDLLYKLCQRGNYEHNTRVIRSGQGQLIVIRRPRCETPAHEYLPCIHCLGFIHMSSVNLHLSQCCVRPKGMPQGSIESCRDLLISLLSNEEGYRYSADRSYHGNMDKSFLRHHDAGGSPENLGMDSEPDNLMAMDTEGSVNLSSNTRDPGKTNVPTIPDNTDIKSSSTIRKELASVSAIRRSPPSTIVFTLRGKRTKLHCPAVENGTCTLDGDISEGTSSNILREANDATEIAKQDNFRSNAGRVGDMASAEDEGNVEDRTNPLHSKDAGLTVSVSAVGDKNDAAVKSQDDFVPCKPIGNKVALNTGADDFEDSTYGSSEQSVNSRSSVDLPDTHNDITRDILTIPDIGNRHRRKRRWSLEENDVFWRIWNSKKMPTRQEIRALEIALPERSAAMIRARCSNKLSGKRRHSLSVG